MAYEYGDRQELLSFTDSGGNIYSVDYDDHGRLAGFTNPDGNRTIYTYSENDLISSVVNPDGSEINYSYNSDFQMVSREDWLHEIALYLDHYIYIMNKSSALDKLGTI